MIVTTSKLLQTVSKVLLLAVFSKLAHGATTTPSNECIERDLHEPVWEQYLVANPQDVETAACVLDFYANRLTFSPDLTPRRIRLIRWIIENHPDIRLTGRFDRDLRVNPADTALCDEVRSLWLAQIARFPDNWRILLNAGQSLALSDSELAAVWLRKARELQPDNFEPSDTLGYIFASAIVGIVASGPELVPTAVDPARAQSAFAKHAWVEAGQDAVLATVTGRVLHSWTNYLRSRGLTRTDYDPLAEQLLERAQELDYPAPARFSALGDLYRDQASKRADPSERLAPKSRIVDLSPTEGAQRGVSAPTRGAGGTPVVCEVIVGTDGHVWSSGVKNAPSQAAADMAQNIARSLVFRPLRMGNELVRFRTTVMMTVEVDTGRVSYTEFP
jgi:hypothetical protein